MKKNYLILLLILFSVKMYSQDTENNTRIGINLLLDNKINFDQIEVKQYEGYYSNNNKTSFKIGLLIEQFLNSNLALNLGVDYSNQNFIGTEYCEVCDYIMPPQPKEFKFQFLEIPLGIKYYFLHDSFRPFLEGGLVNQFAIENDLSDKGYILRGKLGGGLEYNFNSKNSIQAIINYNRGLTNMFEESNYKFETLSLGIGLVHKL